MMGRGTQTTTSTARWDGDHLVIGTQRTITMGDTEIQILNLGRAHTGGDLVVYLPESRVLFMSEIYLRGIFPAMRSAYPSEWVRTIEQAQALDATMVVRGHGFIDVSATMTNDLEASRKAIAAVIAEAKRLHEVGLFSGSRGRLSAGRAGGHGRPRLPALALLEGFAPVMGWARG